MKKISLSSSGSRESRRAEAHRLAGIHAQRAQKWDVATREFESATKLAPLDALMWLNLARARVRGSQLDSAESAARRAFDLDPTPVTCRVLADVLAQLNRPEESLPFFDQLDLEAARDPELHAAHGNALFFSRRPRDAVDAYFKALALKVDDALSHYRLGLAFMDMDMASEAAECFRTALSLGNPTVRALSLSPLVQQGRQACSWKDIEADTRTLLAEVDGNAPECDSVLSPFSLLAIESSPAQQRRMGMRRTRALSGGIAPLPPAGPRRPGPIRVGYLSCDFHHHATAFLVTELLERRDTSRFEVFLYSHGNDDGTEMCRRVRGACEHFLDVATMTHRQIAQRMRDDGIDIAIDLKGHTRDSRFELLGFRPAPVQVAYLGFPGSSGADCIDYVIGDPVVTPLAHAADFSEHIAQLPGCYQPNDASRPLPPCPSRAELGLPEDAIVMCCFNQTYKLSPHMLDLWTRILHGAPNAVLWMLAWNPKARQNLLRELAERGIGEDRVFFAAKKHLPDHIARLRSADLFLDTWPCNAHTTASEALWAGVPVLTVPGPTFASRVAASLVTACGLADLACHDEEHYVNLAVGLANEPHTLQGLKSHLETHRLALPLFDTARYADDFHALLVRMHERQLAGLPPAPLPALQP